MSKGHNWHAVNAQMRKSAGPMLSDKDYYKQRRAKRITSQRELAQAERDMVHPEEILSEEEELEIERSIESIQNDTVSGVQSNQP